MDPAPVPDPAPAARSIASDVWPIVLAYAAFAALWVGLSDAALAWFVTDPARRVELGTVKGVVFVAVTAALLFVLLYRRVQRIHHTAEQERQSQLTQARTMQLLHTLAESSPDAIFVKDRQGRYELINRAGSAAIGVPAEQMLGQDDSAALPPAQAQAIRALDEQVMAQGRAETFEEDIPTPQGVRTFLTTKGPLRGTQGQVTGLFGIARDITETRASQRALEDSERRYRFMFGASPQPMWLIDRETLRFVAANDAVLTWTGFTREEFLAKSPYELADEIDRERLRKRLETWRHERTTGVVHGGVWRQLTKDGQVVECEIDSSDIVIDGRPCRIGMARDVTEQRRLEAERAAAHEQAVSTRDRLQDVLARIDDGFVALDTEWRYTYVNDKAARIIGRDGPQDLIGRHIWTEFPEGVGQPFHRIYEGAMRTQQPARFEEHYAPWDRWFENRVYPSPEGLSIYFTDVTERRRAEQVLRDRERDFRLLAEQMPAIIYRASLDGQGRPLYVSPHIRSLGFTPEQWLADNQHWRHCLHPDDQGRAVAERRAGEASGGEFRLEYRLRDAMGGWRHMRDLARCIVPDDGAEPYVQGVVVDITDHVEAEQALRASEARLRRSERRYRLAAVEDRVWEWDATEGVLLVSANFWRTLGRDVPPPEAALAALEACTWPADNARRDAALVAHLRDHQPYDVEMRAKDVHGEWHWFHSIGQAVWDDDGRAVYMAGTTADITDRKRAEAALHEAGAYRRSLFEQLADGVLLLDHEHRIVDANPQALAMIGQPGGLPQGLTLDALLSPHDRERIDPDLQEMLAGQSRLLEWEIVRRDGTRFPAEVSTRAMDEQRYLAVLRDISTRRDAEKALLSYQLELSELTQRLLTQEKATTQRVAQMLHDNLGQTLAVARLNLDTAVATAAESMPERLRQQCGTVSRLLDDAVRETRNVLADLRPPLLDDQGLMAALDNEVTQRSVAMAEGPDVLLEADERLLGRRWPSEVEYGSFMVAREAIANAQRHAGATLVRVLLAGSADEMTLDVIDDGIGIPAHLQGGRPGHLGLVGMRERAIAIGARLDVLSGGDDAGGTRVRLRWAR